MPVSNKKHTTPQQSQPLASQPQLLLPGQAEFYQHIREQARMGLRVLLEGIMQEELQASWGEITPERKGYRNGFYSRDLGPTQGVIEDLQVPRDREGVFHSQVFERFARYEPQVEEGLREMFVAGVSTSKVSEVAETLIGLAPSKKVRSAVSIVTWKLSSKRGVPVLSKNTGASSTLTVFITMYATANTLTARWY